jgi:hypothetical protein
MPIDVDDLRFARKIERLHQLGLHVEFEVLVELGRRHGIRTAIGALVDRYLHHFTAEMPQVTGGGHPPSPPIHRVASRCDQ